MKMHALIRFGRWREIIDAPLPGDQDLYCVTTAMMRYAKGVACAATGQITDALEHRRQFARAAPRVPASRTVFNNTCNDILRVAAAMLDGELEYRQANYDRAFALLRRAIELDDGLAYDEPWAWMQPARHAYGALLLEQGSGPRSPSAASFSPNLPGAGCSKTPLLTRCLSTLSSAPASQPALAARSATSVAPAAVRSAIRKVATTWTHHGVQRSASAARSAMLRPVTAAFPATPADAGQLIQAERAMTFAATCTATSLTGPASSAEACRSWSCRTGFVSRLAASPKASASRSISFAGAGHWPISSLAAGVTLSTYQKRGSPPVSVLRKSTYVGSIASSERATTDRSRPVRSAMSLTVTM